MFRVPRSSVLRVAPVAALPGIRGLYAICDFRIVYLDVATVATRAFGDRHFSAGRISIVPSECPRTGWETGILA